MNHTIGTYIWNIATASPVAREWARARKPPRGVRLEGEQRIFAVEASSEAASSHVGDAGQVTVLLTGSARMRSDLPTRRDIATYVAQALAEHRSIESVLAELDGEFLLAAYDATNGTVYLAVDPTGHRGLYYGATPYGCIWSSHPARVARFLGAPRLNREGLNLFFALKGVPAPWSLFEGVRKLRPGYVLCAARGTVQEREYWPLVERARTEYTGDLDEASEEVAYLLTAAIQRYAEDVPGDVGVFLSGGLDSTAVLALARRAGLPLRAFTVGYKPAYHGDETEHARHAAHKLDVPIEVVAFGSDDAATLAREVLPRLAEPVADPTLLPQLFLARHTAQRVRHVLDGTGSDVIFAGTTKYTAEPYVRRYQRIPRPVRQGLIEPAARLLPSSRRWRLTNQVRRWQFFASGSDLPFTERAVQWTRFLPHSTITHMLAPEWRLRDDLGTRYLNEYRQQLDRDDITAITYMTLKGHTPWVDYLKLTSIEQESGLSVRVPFMAPPLAEFGMRLPGAFKVQGTEGKHVLRRACEDIIPPGTMQRRKAIFATPISQWIQNDMREMFWETLRQPTGLFDIARLRQMAQLNSLGWRDWQSELWAVFMVQHWWLANTQPNGAVL